MKSTIKIIVPMPDFSLRKMSEFASFDPNDLQHPNKYIFKRFPMSRPQLAESPAFHLDWNEGLTPPNRSDVTTLEPEYYEGVRHHSLHKDIDERWNKRQDYLHFLADLHNRYQVSSEITRRGTFFATQNKNRDSQNGILQRTRTHARAESVENTERRVDAYVMQLFRNEVQLFLRELCPTKRFMKLLAENFGFEPSLTEQSMFNFIEAQEQKTQKTREDQDARRQMALNLTKIIFSKLFSAENRDIEIKPREEYSLDDMRHAQLGKEINLEELKKRLGDEHFMFDLTQKSLADAHEANVRHLKDTNYHQTRELETHEKSEKYTYRDDNNPPRRRK